MSSKPTLSIGVHDDLTAFHIDLGAITRGLVIVGQSGCGKSFILGRLVEELVRNTTDVTRILVIDSNSDFARGMTLKDLPDFEALLEKHQSGLVIDAYEDFQKKELQGYKELQEANTQSQVFGRSDSFDLAWEAIIRNRALFLNLVKGDEYSTQYSWAHIALVNAIEPEFIGIVDGCLDAALELQRLKLNLDVKYKKIKKTVAGLKYLDLLDQATLGELLNDLGWLSGSGVFRDDVKKIGLPESLFAKSKINFLESERIDDKRARLLLVGFVLIYLLIEGMTGVESVRVAQEKGDGDAVKAARSRLKHTFIVLDEAHNLVPDGATDPHERMLGELIHRIAAEGRKYGLHVVLATQRPSKIKSGVLGECDNAIIMKMNSRADLERLAREMRILDVKLLEPCLHFQGKGNALAIGEMTGMAPYGRLFRAAPRRTVEGGVDIEGF